MVIFLPIAFLILNSIPLADIYENLFYIPSVIYPAVRSLPFPGIDQIGVETIIRPWRLSVFAVYAPFIIPPVIFLMESNLIFKKRQTLESNETLSSNWLLIPLMAITCLLFAFKGLVRVSNLHMIQSLVFCVILISIAIARINWRSTKNRILFATGLLPILFVILSTSANGFLEIAKGLKNLTEYNNMLSRCIKPQLPRLRCVSFDNDYLMAARVVMEQSRVDAKIYVGTGRHDKIFMNALAFYFITGRMS